MATAETAAPSATPWMQPSLDNPDIPYYTFPPFPPTEGLNIIPFTEFKPAGIQITLDDDEEELDGYGIPTLTLRVTHDINKDKAKKKKKKHALDGAEGPPLKWYEEWEEGEQLRTAGPFDPRTDRTDRMYQVAADFKTARKFPLPVQALYDEFRLYVGLISSLQPKKNKKGIPDSTPVPAAPEDEDEGDNVSDDELEDMPPAQPEPATALVWGDDALEPVETTVDPETQKDAMDVFFDSPERSVKIFLSSHFRSRGLFWLEYNLYAGPILLRFFLSFIIRHRAFPEYDREFRRALDVVVHAEQELPRTKVAAIALPDPWGVACTSVYGTQIPDVWGLPGLTIDPVEEPQIEEVPDDNVPVAQLVSDDIVPSDLVPEPTAMEILNDSVDLNINGADALLSNPTADPVAEPDATNNGWGVIEPDASAGWGDPEGASVGGWGDSDAGDPNEAWEALGPKTSIFTFVGPSAFPNTHVPVRVERSLREIVAVNPPLEPGPTVSHLHASLATVVLGPWRNCPLREGSELPPPEVVRDDAALFGLTDAYDATNGTITILVDPSVVESLQVGLGLGGLFIQVVEKPRDEADEGEGANGEPKKKKKKSKSARAKASAGDATDGKVWWYVESVSQIIPSYWTNARE